MIKSLQLFYFFIFSSQIVLAQQGQYMIRNYTPPQQQGKIVSWTIRQDNRGFIYAGDDEGLVEFDGVSWKQWSVPYEIKVAQLHGEHVFAGGKGGFGWISISGGTLPKYQEIALEHYSLPSSIEHIYIIRDTVYFYSPEAVYQVSAKTKGIISVIKEKSGLQYSGAVQAGENLYIHITQKGLHLLKDNRLMPVIGSEVLAGTGIVFSAPISDREVLIGTSNSKLYLFDGYNIKPFATSANKLLSQVTMHQAVILLQGQIALATSAGCYILDKNDGRLLQIINSRSGLDSDAVNGVCADKDGGLWLAHDAGISYAAVHLPVYDLNFSKIKSKINGSVYFQNKLFLATDEGVLYLSAKEDKVIEKAPVVVTKKVESVQNNQPETVPVTLADEEKSEKRFLGLFRRKPKNAQETEQSKPASTVSITNITSQTIRQVTQVYKEEGYTFKKVNGISGKCRQMEVLHNKLLVCTENSLFEINNLIAKPVLPVVNIYSFLPSKFNPNILYIGTNAGLFALEWMHGEWKIQGRAKQLTSSISSLAEEKSGVLWAGSSSGLYKILPNTNFGEAIIKKADMFAGQHVQVKKLLNQIYVFTENNIRQINTGDETFEVAPVLQKYYAPYTLFAEGKNNTIWISNEDNSYKLTFLPEQVKADTLHLLKMINGQVTSMHFEQNEVYLATHKSVYKYDYNNLTNSRGLFSSVIRSVKVGKIRELENPLNQQLLTLSYQPDKYDIVFDFAAASFDNQSAVMYQYMLEGSSSEWSDWTKDTKVVYSGLDENRYTFNVRARNLHGEISKSAVFKFEIQPPFWSTWWFYSLQFLFFSLMIGVSFYLNKTKAETRIATILTFVSLFIVFEYIQMLIEPHVDGIAGGAPIFKILMNLLLASLLLPIETYIRTMIREKKIKKNYPKIVFNSFKLS